MTTTLTDDAAPVLAARCRIALLGEPELVVVGLTSLLRAHTSRLQLVAPRPGSPIRADVLLCDTQQLDPAGAASLVERARAAGTRFAEFSWRVEPELVRQARSRGAAGYVYKGLDAASLVQALERVAAGEWTEPPPPAPRVATRPGAAARGRSGLSGRELEMLTYIGLGISNEDIAARCYLSINSVKTYIRMAYRKIGVSRRSQAVRWAIEHDLASLDGPHRS